MTIVINPPRRRRLTSYQLFLRNNPEFAEEIVVIRRFKTRALNKLADLAPRNQHSRVRALLRDRRLQTFYAFAALRRSHGLQGATVQDVRDLASRWNPFARHHEPVRMFSVPGRAKPRSVVSFGPLRRMHQLMIADVIKTLHPPGPEQFLFNRGMPAALAAVEAAICRDGYNFACEVDIEHFYANIRLVGLAELLRPLPVSIVSNVVWDNGIRRMVDGDTSSWSSSDPSLSGLVGLAAGAATSPIVGECIVRQMIANIRGVRLATYADNIFVLGRNAGEVEACIEHLSSAAERLETGPLRLRIGDVFQFGGPSRFLVDPPFTFLHHEGHLSADRREVEWRPDQRKLLEYQAANGDWPMSEEMIARLESKVSHWRRAYPDWPEGDGFEAQQIAALAARRFYQSANPPNLTKAAHALVMAFCLHDVLRIEELAPSGTNASEERRRQELIETTLRYLTHVRMRPRRAVFL